jgi:hypothetical protein
MFELKESSSLDLLFQNRVRFFLVVECQHCRFNKLKNRIFFSVFRGDSYTFLLVFNLNTHFQMDFNSSLVFSHTHTQ